jgi:hypothetical protein
VAELRFEFLVILLHSCFSREKKAVISEQITISFDLISTSEYLESDGTATVKNKSISKIPARKSLLSNTAVN